MSIDKGTKNQLIKEYSIKEGDTGSPEVQCAILTTRIDAITNHLKINKKDFASRRGLLILVGRRRRLLNYVRKKSVERYADLIKRLGIRK